MIGKLALLPLRIAATILVGKHATRVFDEPLIAPTEDGTLW